MTQPVIRRARERRTIILAQSSLLDDRRPAQESRSLVPPWLSLTPPAWMYVRQRPARRRPELVRGPPAARSASCGPRWTARSSSPPEHAALLAAMLGRTGQLSTEIARLSEVTGQQRAPYEEQLQQAESMPRPAKAPATGS